MTEVAYTRPVAVMHRDGKTLFAVKRSANDDFTIDDEDFTALRREAWERYPVEELPEKTEIATVHFDADGGILATAWEDDLDR